MGNQLVSSVKTVIRPIDFYLNEVADFKFKCSLGQTQFLKVALCAHHEGDIVVKVLSHEDPSLLLEHYKQELKQLAKITAKNVSIASFRIVEIRSNFAYMARQFVRYSLYDRLSTRPFLTDIEKCWIVYQIFRCMQWCHEKNIYHGDIKLENILITSNLWVVISDFASYKPVNLPEDNPTFFNYFFDTSRRRCCNIAPERFVPSNLSNQLENMSIGASYLQQQNSNIFNLFLQEGQLTYKMDMFSLGCILAEIYSDNNLFDLGGLLNYKENKNDDLEQSLGKIQNEHICSTVRNLISLDPKQRKSCAEVLNELSGKFFPKYFDQLYSLMENLIRLPPDAKVLYLSQNLDYYLNTILEENAKGILILLMTLTSSIRSFKHIFCKIQAQRLICRMVMASPILSTFITDRLIPYLVYCLNDKDHRVRGATIESITQLLEQVQRLPPSDNNLFTDFLLEKFQKCMANEKSVYVRICMAKNISRLSKIALNFLNQYCDHNYDEELNLLHRYFQNLVSILITDSNNCVRRILLSTPETCAQLCTFFGRQKTNEVILSHIITFLNDKNDFKLRISFFDNIVVIASYLGVQCSTILHPLLQQGLCDAEEIIIGKSITAIASLIEQGLISKNVIIDLLQEIMPLIYHPNQWIINSMIHFIEKLGTHLSLVDLNTKVLPLMQPFFHLNINCFTAQLYSSRSFEKPIPRNIYEIVLMAKDRQILISFFELLETRLSQPDYDSTLSKHNPIYKRLLAENININVEKQLFSLRDLMIKIYRNKRNYQSLDSKQQEYGSVLHKKKYDGIRLKEIRLLKPISYRFGYMDDEQASSANQEWLHMFGPNNSNMIQGMANEECGHLMPHDMKDLDYLFFECPPYTRDIQLLELHKKNTFIPFSPMAPALSPSIRPRGYLVNHLYEHQSSVNQMIRINKSNMFLTCSDDGSIRLWDLCDDPSRYVITRSRFQFRLEFSNNSPINFKGIINCGPFIITYSNDCVLHVFELDQAQIMLLCAFRVGNAKPSAPCLISSICSLSETSFAVSLTDSRIYIYDTRYFNSQFFNLPVMKLQTPPSQRCITSIDGSALILFASTACGYINGFDLRFHLKMSNYIYNSKESTRIARIKYTPMGLFSSAYGSFDVTLWDYKFGQKSKILSAVNNTNHNNHNAMNATNCNYNNCNNVNNHLEPYCSSAVVNAILPVTSDSSMAVITGGSDMRIRYWDLHQPEHSYIISDPMYKSCNFCLTSNHLTTACKSTNQMNKVTIPLIQSTGVGSNVTAPTSRQFSNHTFPSASEWHYGFNQPNSGSNNPAAVAAGGQMPVTPPPPLTTYREVNQEEGVIKIVEQEFLSSFQSFQSMHHCVLDQQLMAFAHEDTIMDIININQYLISCGRNGAVKVWR